MTVLGDVLVLKSYINADTTLKLSLYQSIEKFMKSVKFIYTNEELEYIENDIRKHIDELKYKGESSYSIDHGPIKLGWYLEDNIQPISFIEFHITTGNYFNSYNLLNNSVSHGKITELNSLDLANAMSGYPIA